MNARTNNYSIILRYCQARHLASTDYQEQRTNANSSPGSSSGKEKKHENDKGEESSGVPLVYPTRAQLYKVIPQDRDKIYLTEAVFDQVLFVLVKREWLYKSAFDGALEAMKIFTEGNPDREATIFNVPRLMQVNFLSLRIPRHNYATQAMIEPRQAWLLAACAVHYDLDFCLCARYLGGEYTVKWRDVKAILRTVRGLVSEVDLNPMRRILNHGYPAEFNLKEPAKNKEAFVRRGNNPSVKKKIEVVHKTMNDGERKSHVIPFPCWVVWASPNA